MCRKFLAVIVAMLMAGSVARAADSPMDALTEARVCDYIAMRIETNRLQQEFRENAAQYHDVPRAFFKARNELLRERGWSVKGFEATQERIINAQTGIDMAADLEARADERAEEKQKVRNNAALSEEQKRQMVAMQEQLYQAELAQAESTRADWPAVRGQLDRLEHLTDWIAGNRPDAPEPCD